MLTFGGMFGARRLRRLGSVGEAWLGRRPDTAKVAGSNPAEPTTYKIVGPFHLPSLIANSLKSRGLLGHTDAKSTSTAP